MALFKEGEIVVERIRPNQKLIVVGVRGNIYSCIAQENPAMNPLTYFERYQLVRVALNEAGLNLNVFSVVPFPINSPEHYRYYVLYY